MKYHFPSRKIDVLALQKECHNPRLCPHDQKQIRRKRDKNGTPMYYYQCLSCDCSVGKRVKKELVKDPEVVEDFEVEKERKAWENYYTRYRKREKEEMDRVEKTWWKNYDLYIDSPEWKEKRRLVFKRAGGVCEGCLSAEATDCHHTTYDNMGQEFLFELLALCRDCHRRYHARIFPEFLKRLRTDIIINSGRNQDEPGEMSNG